MPIRTKVRPLLVIALLLAWWLACWWCTGIWQDKAATQVYHDARQRIEQFVTTSVVGYERIIATRLGLIRVLAREHSFRDALSQHSLLSTANNEDERRRNWNADPRLTAVNLQLATTAHDLGMQSIWLMDANGDCIASSNAGEPTDHIGTRYADRDYFQAALAGRSAYQVNIGRRRLGANIGFSAPVADQHGRVIGVLAGGNDLATFTNWLDQAEAFFTDRHGVVVLAKDPAMALRALPDAPVQGLDAATRLQLYKTSDIQTLSLPSLRDDQFPELLRFTDGTAPAILASRSVADGGLALHVLQPLPQLANLKQLRPIYAAAFGMIGSLLVLFVGTVLLYGRHRRATLVEREREFRSLAESSPDFICRYDREGRHLYFNDHLLKLLGLASADETLGKRPGEVWPDGRFAELEQVVARAMENGNQEDIEIIQPAEEGSFRYHQIFVVPERDAGGQVIGAIAFGREITTIREAERKLAHFINNLPGMAYTFRTLPNGRGCFPYVSPAIQEFCGLKPEDVKDDMAPIFALVHPDDRPRIEAAMAETSRVLRTFQIELRICRMNKPERWIDMRCVPERQADGSLLWYGLMLDISERKEAERKLKEALEFSEGIINAIPDLLFEVDRNGRYLNVWTQKPELLAASKEQLLNKTVHEVLSPEGAAIAMEGIREAEERGASFGKEICIELPQGTAWFEHSLSKKPSDGAFLVLSRDITARKHLEIELQQREREFRALAENLPDPVFRYDRDCRRIYVNPTAERVTRTLSDQLIGYMPADSTALESDSAARLTQAIREVFVTGERRSLYINYTGEDGSTREYQGVLVPEFNATGQVASVLSIAHEVTSIRETERRLTRFAANAPGFFYTAMRNANGGFAMPYVSSGIRDIHGIEPEALAEDSTSLVALTHPDDVERLFSLAQESERNLTHYHLEYRINHPQKGERWIESSSMPIREADGSVVWNGFMHDITERKRMEVDLVDSRNFLETVINSIHDPISVKDREHRWILLNDTCCTMIGQPREVLIGKTDHDFLLKEQADVFWEKDDLVFSSGEVSINEEVLTSVNGTTRHLLTQKSPFAFSDGQRYVVATSRDITERKRMENELHLREQKFRTLAENAPDNIIRYDMAGRIVYVNPVLQRTLGVSASSLIGTRPRDNPFGTRYGEYVETLDKVLASGEGGEMEVTLTDAMGTSRVHHIRMVAERDEAGDMVGVLTIGRDITELKRYEAARDAALAEAVRLAKARSEFLAQMSHELRTPLNSILGYTQILQRDQALGERHTDALNVMYQSGEHLLALIEDILDLARIEAGRLTLDMGEISLAIFLRGVADIISIRALEKGIEFRCDFSHDLPTNICADEKRLRQVLLNLLVNAVKFTNQGRVILHVRRVDALHLAFMVEDTGMGIPAEDLESIFLPFEQSGNARQRFGGTGLGLSISRQLMHLMGSNIWVESRLGVGSRFGFDLELPATAALSCPAFVVPETDRRSPRPGNVPAVATRDRRMATPPTETLQNLYRLAQLGNMRDIVQYSQHIEELNAQYQPFAAHLRQLAQGYQSKAILAFVSIYIQDASSE